TEPDERDPRRGRPSGPYDRDRRGWPADRSDLAFARRWPGDDVGHAESAAWQDLPAVAHPRGDPDLRRAGVARRGQRDRAVAGDRRGQLARSNGGAGRRVGDPDPADRRGSQFFVVILSSWASSSGVGTHAPAATLART